MNQLATRTSTYLIHDRELSIMLAGYQNALIGTSIDKEIAPADREALQNRLVRLNDGLRPAAAMTSDKIRVGKALADLLAGFQNVRGDPQGIISSYTFHLQDLPAFAIEDACKKISKGQVDDLNPDFPPSAARLHQVAAEACQYWRREEQQISQVLNAKVLTPINEEERERVAKGLHDLANEMRLNELERKQKSNQAFEIGEIVISDELKAKIKESA